MKTIQRVYNGSKEINYTGDWEHQYYSCIPNPPGDSELLFTRWCTSPDLSEETELAEGTIIDRDTTLYAKYDDIFTVNIDAQGQQLDAMAPIYKKSFSVKQGESLDISFIIYYLNGKVPFGIFKNVNALGTNLADAYSINTNTNDYEFSISDYTPSSSETWYICYCDPIPVTCDANGGMFPNDSTIYIQKRAPGLKCHETCYMEVLASQVKREGFTLKGRSHDKNATEGFWSAVKK